jgi:plasmid stabilization system protein ParE
MRTVLWNKLARQDYFENIDYLIQNWSFKEAQKFIGKVSDVESILVKGGIDFQNTDRIGIKRCVLIRQITLFYKVNSNNTIELLRFWNNSQSLKNLKL